MLTRGARLALTALTVPTDDRGQDGHTEPNIGVRKHDRATEVGRDFLHCLWEGRRPGLSHYGVSSLGSSGTRRLASYSEPYAPESVWPWGMMFVFPLGWVFDALLRSIGFLSDGGL